MYKATERLRIGASISMIATTIIVTLISLPLTSQIALAQGNVTQGAQGVPGAINATGQFVGNVSETIAENPVVANATKETQEFFGESSK